MHITYTYNLASLGILYVYMIRSNVHVHVHVIYCSTRLYSLKWFYVYIYFIGVMGDACTSNEN